MTDLTKQKQLIATAFMDKYRLRHDPHAPCAVYDAPAAESWIVIMNGEAWIAQCGDGMHEDGFCFWGPPGKKSISFPVPDGWPT